MNSSTASTCSHVVSTLFLTMTSIISLAAFIGNFLVTVTFLKTPSLRTSTNYYIVNMAISDILCSCFNLLLYTTEGMLTSRVLITEPSASVLCKLGMYSRGVSQAVSVLSLVLIAVDRYIAIVFPLKTAMVDQRTVRLTLSVFTWIIPIAFCCPFVIYAKIITVDDNTFCRLLWNASSHTIFNVAGFVAFYCTPFVVTIVLYTRIVKALRKRPVTGDEMQDSVSNKRRRQHQKITKILISIVVVFFVCWTPLCIYLALKMFYPDLFVQDHCQILLALFFYIFPSLSTAMNPLILFLFSTNYREALANLCPQSCNRCRTSHRSKNNRILPSHKTHETSVHMTDQLERCQLGRIFSINNRREFIYDRFTHTLQTKWSDV